VNPKLKLAVQAGSLVTILTLAPLAFSPGKGVHVTKACAQNGTCCFELNATCVVGTYSQLNAYYKTEGSCQHQL
jgi:hypothetical protein